MSYFFHPRAQADHLDAIAYYERRRAGLGASYLHSFESAIALAVAAPNRYRVEREPGIRRIALVRFPFHAIFRETPSGIQVLAVAHYRRRPDYWVTRI